LEVETDKAMMEVNRSPRKLKIASVAVGDAIVAGQLMRHRTDSIVSP